jgi:hypothetical protein
MFTKKRKYGEISFDCAFRTSSITPMTNAISADKKIAPIVLFQGSNNAPLRNAPKKRAMPPPLGKGTLWRIAGCFLLGSSIRPYFFVYFITTGVINTVKKKARKNGIKKRSKNINSYNNNNVVLKIKIHVAKQTKKVVILIIRTIRGRFLYIY